MSVVLQILLSVTHRNTSLCRLLHTFCSIIIWCQRDRASWQCVVCPIAVSRNWQLLKNTSGQMVLDMSKCFRCCRYILLHLNIKHKPQVWFNIQTLTEDLYTCQIIIFYNVFAQKNPVLFLCIKRYQIDERGKRSECHSLRFCWTISFLILLKLAHLF